MDISTEFAVSRDLCSPTQHDDVPLVWDSDSHDSVGGPPISPVVLSKSKKRQAEPTEPGKPDDLKPDACDADPCYPSKRYKENSTEAQMFPPLHVQASKAYNDGHFLLAAHRFRLLLCLHREQKSKSIPGYPDTDMVQVCLNLTQCYLNLKKAETAHEVLEDVWRPNRLLTIEVTHPLFKDLSRLYLETFMPKYAGLADVPKFMLTKEKDRSVPQTDNQRESLKLIYDYGTQYLFEGQPQNAVVLLRNAVSQTEGKKCTGIGESTKDELVKIHLLLAEALLSLGQLQDVQDTLKKLWSPIHDLYIDQRHQHFLWLARVHARATKPKPGANNENNCFTIKKLDFYERLGLSHTADNIAIKKAYRRCSLIFHPDKGGDALAFQQIREAYEALSLSRAHREQKETN